MTKRNLALVLGARPNFVKAACLVRELQERSSVFDYAIINTGQHHDYEMAKIFFEELDLHDPDIDLAASGRTHVETIGNILRKMNDVFNKSRFDYAVLFGDVNSTLAAGIAGAKQHLRLAHVEAGLRSGDRRMPEEINRVIIDHVSDLLFTTEKSGRENLLKEGIHEEKIHFVGNIMIDTLVRYRDQFVSRNRCEAFDLEKKDYVLVTVHRQENVDERNTFRRIVELIQHAGRVKRVLMPLHPRTRQMINDFGYERLLSGIVTVSPQGYLDFLSLMNDAYAVITDSGGIQEETSFLDIPCITLRDSTERPITIDLGTNVLVPIHEAEAERLILRALENHKRRRAEIPLWDGKTAGRIADILEPGAPTQ
jgi:UDP-N-acetylglucosamine 2-epimerase (non-hydrolysing)